EIARFLQADGNSKRLHRAQDHGEITRPLGDFLPAQFTFFLQLGERLIYHGQQLQNDRRRNVRHDAERENREPPQVAAAEQIDEAEHRAPVLLEKLRQAVAVDPGRRDVAADAIHRQQAEREQHALAKVGNPEDVRQLFQHYCKTSNLPPALVIFSCADLENLWACTVSATESSPLPRTFTGCLVLITPALRSTSGVIVVSPSAARRSRFTMLYSWRKTLVNPRLGMRRCNGIWPPSKPRIMREPLRERWPLWPRVDVLPMPEPMPRPTRLRFSDDFFGARIFDRFIRKLSAISRQLSALHSES